MATPTQAPIETERLILRQLEPSDGPKIFKFMSQDAVMRYTSRAPLTEPHQATTFLSTRTTGPSIYNFAVTLRDGPGGPAVIGVLGSPDFPEIGYLFDPAYGKRGYATEALQAYMPCLFAAMPGAATGVAATTGSSGDAVRGFDYAEAHVDTENGASVALLERCGWTRVGGVSRAEYTSPLLGIRDSFLYRIARPGCRLEGVFAAVEEEEEGQPFVPDLC